MEQNAILEKARELGKLLQADPAYKNMVVAREKNDNDTELQDLIGKFNLKRIELNQAMSEADRNQDKINAVDAELKAIYQKIMENENMHAYDKATNEMNLLMNKVNRIITGAANGEDPDAIDTEASCTGSCSSCSGCH